MKIFITVARRSPMEMARHYTVHRGYDKAVLEARDIKEDLVKAEGLNPAEGHWVEWHPSGMQRSFLNGSEPFTFTEGWEWIPDSLQYKTLRGYLRVWITEAEVQE